MTRQERIDLFLLQVRRLDMTIPPKLLYRTTVSRLNLDEARQKLAAAVRDGDLRAIATAEKEVGRCVDDIARHLHVVNGAFFPLIDLLKIGQLVLADNDRSAMN